jgi:hypothetical protein
MIKSLVDKRNAVSFFGKEQVAKFDAAQNESLQNFAFGNQCRE